MEEKLNIGDRVRVYGVGFGNIRYFVDDERARISFDDGNSVIISKDQIMSIGGKEIIWLDE